MVELKKTYSPKDIEDKWYIFWEENGYFSPNPRADRSPFCIVIPPPNVTGSLHMGHALNVTIQDILVRWKRMLGHKVLWLPGTDHAGIATQNVVEREISKEGIDRHKLGRDAFIERVWKWKAEYGGKIIYQLKKLGASCDWTRERFTLDEGLSRAVREVFVRLFEEGLIYRDNRLINWCPRCHTALSDLEVEYEEIEGRLYDIKYPLTDGNGYITVSTTRPETMLGDTAVAVHPDDERYRDFIGKTIDLPLTGRKIPVVADTAVDPAFGTGAVKVTPAHDFNDEAIGKRHNLNAISVITEDGRMSLEAGDRYKGLDRYVCRKKVLEDLQELGLLDGSRRHNHSVGHCYRCKTIIEPMLTIQWYVKIKPLSEEAVKVVEGKRIRLIPEQWENNYFAWMRDIKDWCISRQIWWGHQIPVWYCPDCKGRDGMPPQGEMIEHIFFEPIVFRDDLRINGGIYSELRRLGISHEDIIKNSKIMRISKNVKPICSRNDLKECPECGSKNIIRDPDVLDTWFSSALWPFSTLGWPDETDDLKTFYPTSVLVTGFDILFFWVARMIMMGLKFMNEVPFKDVYIHALVRDSKGQKMSKSKGNVIDPLIMIDRYGADAFRFTLAAFAAQGRDVRFSEDRVEGYRYFINKLWNAARFIVNNGQLWMKQPLHGHDKDFDLPSRWILSRLAFTAKEVNRNLENYRFNDAASSIYQFVWHEFCDWYIEFTKPVLYHGSSEEKATVINCLFFVLENIIRLLHPFMPFVTEELWTAVFEQDKSIMTFPYPEDLMTYPDAEEKMNYVINAVTGIRSVRGELNISPSLEIRADIKTSSKEVEDVLKNNLNAIMKLTRCRDINISTDIRKEKGSAVSVKDKMEIYIPIEGLINVNAEIERLQKERLKIDDAIAVVEKKLSNEDFIKNAPYAVIEKERAKFEDLAHKKAKIKDNIKLLKTIT
ncbi:valine--tRNA ligase [Dissulfurispira thermophila]|uniref:Valine--tRNA ligase n=2 Tax=root TaxID=1 RepID=A0A7G1H0S4_9BACT|nr:valine--tRNA ligase [Dissulfurispira thermophila]BCB96400.1 valine--tRNA ligase [Dissulfurispira thermophila]